MSWRIVYIEESEYLSLYLDNIKVKNNNQDILIPISDIHTLIIDNYKAVISINLLNKCSENKVNIILCGLGHMPKTIIYPISGNNQTPAMLKKQFNWSDKLKGILQQKIVIEKINNQIKVLIRNNKNKDVINKIKGFARDVLPFDSSNREGLSAKMYFRELFGTDFIRFKDDSINAGLNYGYAILRTQISKTLISRGLNTSIGIFHRGAENMFNLSDDIIEVFRPIIDDFIFNNINNDTLFSRELRIKIVKLTTNRMIIKNENHTFFNVINIFVGEIINCLETGCIDISFPEIFINDI